MREPTPRPTPQATPPDESPVPALPPVPRGFVSIFNGKDLSGWVVDGGAADEWQVVGGVIVTNGRRGGPRTWLLSEHDYGNMRVRFEYQLDAGGNSGFAFRAVPGERPILRPGDTPTPTAYHQQVELADDTAQEWQWLPTGQIAGGRGKDGLTIKPVRPACLQPSSEWNAVEIELVGQSLKMTVNGELVQDADLNQLVAQGSLLPALARVRGRIGFQQLARTVRFRNVEILDLEKNPGPTP